MNSPQVFAATVLAAIIAISALAFGATRSSEAPITAADLQSTASSTAAAILSTGNLPTVNTTWQTAVNGKSVTFTVTAATATSLTLSATADGVTVLAGVTKRT